MDFDGLGIKLETFLLVGQELLNILTLISLQLNHLSHLSVIDDGAIACYKSVSCFESYKFCRRLWKQHTELLLDHLQDLLLIELLRKTLNCGQGLATIAFCSGRRLVTIVSGNRICHW